MRLAPVVSLSGCLSYLPPGAAGVHRTLATMRALVNRYRSDLGIRSAATTTIYLQPERSDGHEVSALYELVRDQIRYTRDVVGVETLMSPDKTLELGFGDCDDQSVLLATLLESVGYPTRFVAAGYHNPGELEHVYVQVQTADGWIDADPTERRYLGWAPPNPVTIFTEGA